MLFHKKRNVLFSPSAKREEDCLLIVNGSTSRDLSALDLLLSGQESSANLDAIFIRRWLQKMASSAKRQELEGIKMRVLWKDVTEEVLPNDRKHWEKGGRGGEGIHIFTEKLRNPNEEGKGPICCTCTQRKQ